MTSNNAGFGGDEGDEKCLVESITVPNVGNKSTRGGKHTGQMSVTRSAGTATVWKAANPSQIMSEQLRRQILEETAAYELDGGDEAAIFVKSLEGSGWTATTQDAFYSAKTVAAATSLAFLVGGVVNSQVAPGVVLRVVAESDGTACHIYGPDNLFRGLWVSVNYPNGHWRFLYAPINASKTAVITRSTNSLDTTVQLSGHDPVLIR